MPARQGNTSLFQCCRQCCYVYHCWYVWCTACVQVDVRSATELGTSGSEVALDQISVSDVIVGTKSDLASEQQVERFEEWAAGLWPPKAQVCVAVRAYRYVYRVSMEFV